MKFYLGYPKTPTDLYEISPSSTWDKRFGFREKTITYVCKKWVERLLGKQLRPGEMIEVDIKIKPVVKKRIIR